MVHLFRGYLQARDANFCQYLERKKETWEEGTDFTPDELMTWALNKYTLLKSRHKWGLESAEDQLVVLTSTVNDLKDDNLKLTRALSQKVSNKSNKGLAPPRPKFEGEPKKNWKKVPPLPGTPFTMVRDGKHYNWCRHHKAWGSHLPSQCEKNKPYNPKTKNKKENYQGSYPKSFGVVMASGLDEDSSDTMFDWE
jgi:hypothetical protein